MISHLPDEYREAPESELIERIHKVKKRLGSELVILAHHYQRQQIVDLGDFRGDSYKLCVVAADQTEARYIVFCGVEFMAESAAILARENQTVFHPDFDAGCPMADMADLESVERVWADLSGITDISRIIPVTYMNSGGDIKAFCGARSGCVVTSSNAPAGFRWAFERGDKVLFFPDEHLGTNSAYKLGIPPEEIVVWDHAGELGGATPERIQKARVIIWKGYCHVHTWFTTEHVRKVREEHPDALVVVHPECPREVVEISDADGSTEFIIKYAREAPAGAHIAVGTEFNLVARLAETHKDRNVFELSHSLCPNMHKINLNNLCYTLENLPEVNRVEVDTSLRQDARKALQRMLEIK